MIHPTIRCLIAIFAVTSLISLAHSATSSPQPISVMPAEPVYFSLGFNEATNARFQLSLKIRPIGPYDEREVGSSFFENLYVQYSQTSIWDLESESKPFYDTSYRPSLFYERYKIDQTFLGADFGYSIGFEHESNGQSGDASRSLNIAFLNPEFRWNLRDDWLLVFSPKLYTYLEKSENPDIQDYRGYGDYHISIEHPDSWKLMLTARLGESNKGSIILDASYPWKRIFNRPNAKGYLHLQLFQGYTESLRSYNKKSPTQIRVGYMLLR